MNPEDQPDTSSRLMLKLIEVEPRPGYRLWLKYADGTAGDVDLPHLAGKGVFQRWNDPQTFARVSIGSCGELRRSDEVDLCADALYLELTGKSPEEVFPNIRKATTNA